MTEAKRDLNEDLRIISEATVGEWAYELLPPSMSNTRRFTVGAFNGVCTIIGDIESDTDARFITEARAGWEHAIKRAIEAETELTALTEGRANGRLLLRAKHAEGALIGKEAELSYTLGENELLRAENEYLRLQRESLEAVVQHYRGYA